MSADQLAEGDIVATPSPEHEMGIWVVHCHIMSPRRWQN